MNVPEDLLSILACPICKTEVVRVGEEIICKNCTRRYPVRNGIPIMLAEEAVQGKS